TVEVDADGSARWSGATLEAPVLSREAVAQVAVTFEHAANAPFEPLSPSPVVADLLASADGDIETSGDGTDDDAGGSQEAMHRPRGARPVLGVAVGDVRRRAVGAPLPMFAAASGAGRPRRVAGQAGVDGRSGVPGPGRVQLGRAGGGGVAGGEHRDDLRGAAD